MKGQTRTDAPLAGTAPTTAATANIAEVRARIAEAARRAGRAPEDVTLLAVSKYVPALLVSCAVDAGQLVFGESRVQEAKEKWVGLRLRQPDVNLHMIGPLQSNKVRDAVQIFDTIETLDRPRLCAALARHSALAGRLPELFVQVNTGLEPQKTGVLPDDADAFIETCRAKYGLMIAGLMCVPPVGGSPVPHFALLAEIAHRNGVRQLSMGMSADYELAIEHGATHVRVGTGIFGPRPAH